MYNPPRLVLAFVAAAAERGAVVANHVEAERLLIDGGRVIGVRARDRLSGDALEIRARVTINAAGPWAEGLLGPAAADVAGTYSRDACFVAAREPPPMALAVQGATRDQDALVARAARHLFLVPWRGHTLIGVWHTVVPRDPDGVRLGEAELARFIEEINAAHPALGLRLAQVRAVCYGLVPFGEAARQRPGALSFGKESRIVDHRRAGLAGLVSAVSVRYTVARRDAAAALDLACRQLRAGAATHDSASRPLPGGDIEDFARFALELERGPGAALPAAARQALARNHGTRAARVLALCAADGSLAGCVGGTSVLRAEIAYAVREEMAQRLADVVVRRTELGTAGHPGEQALAEALEIMRRECGWTAARAAEERAATEQHFARYLSSPPPARAVRADTPSAVLRRA